MITHNITIIINLKLSYVIDYSQITVNLPFFISHKMHLLYQKFKII